MRARSCSVGWEFLKFYTDVRYDTTCLVLCGDGCVLLCLIRNKQVTFYAEIICNRFFERGHGHIDMEKIWKTIP